MGFPGEPNCGVTFDKPSSATIKHTPINDVQGTNYILVGKEKFFHIWDYPYLDPKPDFTKTEINGKIRNQIAFGSMTISNLDPEANYVSIRDRIALYPKPNRIWSKTGNIFGLR